eukprot:gene12979-14973_t
MTDNAADKMLQTGDSNVIEPEMPEKPEIVALAADDRQQGLLWSMSDVRRLFNEYRMWPTFVGPRFLIHGVSRITLPVLLWKEQESYLQNSTEQTAPSSSSAKRKRSDDDGVFSPTPEKKCQFDSATVMSQCSEEENTRNKIFQDLHDRKYFVGPADAYGGDYSLYKGGGDPTQTHSIATVRVIEKGHKITAKELLAFSRVQNQVAKSAVLAFKLPVEQTGTASKDTVDKEGSVVNSGVGYIMINFRNVSDRV